MTSSCLCVYVCKMGTLHYIGGRLIISHFFQPYKVKPEAVDVKFFGAVTPQFHIKGINTGGVTQTKKSALFYLVYFIQHRSRYMALINTQ